LDNAVEVKVRNFRKGDEVCLAKLFSECFGPTTPRQLSEWLGKSEVAPEDIFVGVVDGKLVSHVNVEFRRLDHGEGVHLKTAGIAGVCTDSDYRRKGIVTNLMKRALESARQKGVSNASLFTGLDFPAIRIYRRLGFVDIVTWRTYIKYVDYPAVFAKWLRVLNRSLKCSKIMARKLEGWEKSVVVRLKEVGALSFRFRRGRFKWLREPPKHPDIDLYSDMETYVRIVHGAVEWDEAVKQEKLTVNHGEPADVEMFKRILLWRWDE
jgi:ribosomal protein S18 acetylase RimI-like enzyme